MRLLVSLIVVLAVAGSASPAFGSRAHVTAAAVVDFRALARLDRMIPRAAPAPAPEPQERAEPNVRITVPSPFAPLLAPATLPPEPSPYVSASFLAQADAPAQWAATS